MSICCCSTSQEWLTLHCNKDDCRILSSMRLSRLCSKSRGSTHPTWPISGHCRTSFMSKVVEKAVSRQLNEHLSDQGLMPRHQSAYRKHHSTETTMLRVMSDALTAADQRRVTLIGRWICRPPSTASTMPCCCNDYNARSACLERFCVGCVEVCK